MIPAAYGHTDGGPPGNTPQSTYFSLASVLAREGSLASEIHLPPSGYPGCFGTGNAGRGALIGAGIGLAMFLAAVGTEKQYTACDYASVCSRPW